VDSGSFVELDANIISADPLQFVSQSQQYAEKLESERQKVQLNEAVVIGHALIENIPLALAVMDFRFIGGSMSAAVGEKITRAIELGIQRHIPVLIVSASGGARMQEGIHSLMQMAKTSAALAKLGEANIPYFSLLTDPTTGGVTASFAMLGDIIIAEPGGLICFAGPRVIEQFMHVQLPEDAVTAEFVYQHGLIDAIVPRRALRKTLARFLHFYASVGTCVSSTCQRPSAHQTIQAPQTPKTSSDLTSWQTLQIARHSDRPYAADYLHLMCDDFFELHGDRAFGDDHSILAGLGILAGNTIMFICQQKGRTTKEKQYHNFGMPHPEGYRKAYRLMSLAEKFSIPLVCLIDTPGAFTSLEDEEHGQSSTIAANLYLMSRLRIPIISVVIGEGSSGGALAISIADRLLMLEYSIYTVAAPEAAASILWRDKAFAQDAANAMKISARELLETPHLIDGLVPEPVGGAHNDPRLSAEYLKGALLKHLSELRQISLDQLLESRYQKYRGLGAYSLVETTSIPLS
jgi:acetyl-CoA carboxylase carboxyl transferase alpha subunit/acetyl-CoA carboxylase carboxyl transferase beta subunit